MIKYIDYHKLSNFFQIYSFKLNILNLESSKLLNLVISVFISEIFSNLLISFPIKITLKLLTLKYFFITLMSEYENDGFLCGII